jgi:peptidoglycan-associated lipoprotein
MKSRKGFARACTVAGVFLLAVPIMAACSKKPKHTPSTAGAEGPVTPGSPREFSAVAGDRVLFTVDSAQLSASARETLKGQAQWLARYPGYTATIEGHADERGTREYNIALGARRAEAVRTFLMSQGVNASRMRTISYGKERPVATCDDISCWSQNRRAVTALGRARGS